MQLQVKLEKTAEVTYLEAKKQQTVYRNIFRSFKVKKKGTTDVLTGKGQHER